jgi:hypothetical protein
MLRACVHLVQLLLPLADPDGHRFAARDYVELARKLTARFGGVTAYARAPASGLWDHPRGGHTRDELIVMEVMVESLDAAWWATYRLSLEGKFRHDELVVRAWPLQQL